MVSLEGYSQGLPEDQIAACQVLQETADPLQALPRSELNWHLWHLGGKSKSKSANAQPPVKYAPDGSTESSVEVLRELMHSDAVAVVQALPL